MTSLKKFDFSGLNNSHQSIKKRGEDYFIEPALNNAVNVALLLRMPLLITGKPGTGKTDLAYKLAIDLSNKFPEQYLPFPLVFHTKTLSIFTDLLYSYDALGHFQEANIEKISDASRHIQLNTLGQAVFLSNGQYKTGYRLTQEISDFVEKNKNRPNSCVVLIDEVDKAPRDFTNDLLNEFENLNFTIREDKHTTYKKGKGNIIIILTSNSEKSLPDAFLRRCVFYHIDIPDDDMLKKIILSKLFTTDEDKHNDELIVLESYLFEYNFSIKKKLKRKEPTTAELISWFFFLRNEIIAGTPLAEVEKNKLEASFGILAKDSNDLAELKKIY